MSDYSMISTIRELHNPTNNTIITYNDHNGTFEI